MSRSVTVPSRVPLSITGIIPASASLIFCAASVAGRSAWIVSGAGVITSRIFLLMCFPLSPVRFPGGKGGKLAYTLSGTVRLLVNAAPEFAAELEEGLRAVERPDLAEQVRGLQLREVCRCEVEGCASFYTAT